MQRMNAAVQDLANRVEKLEKEQELSSGRKKNRLRMRDVRKAEHDEKYGGRVEGGAPLLKTDKRLPYKTWALVADQFATDMRTPPPERVPKYLRFLMRLPRRVPPGAAGEAAQSLKRCAEVHVYWGYTGDDLGVELFRSDQATTRTAL